MHGIIRENYIIQTRDNSHIEFFIILQNVVYNIVNNMHCRKKKKKTLRYELVRLHDN